MTQVKVVRKGVLRYQENASLLLSMFQETASQSPNILPSRKFLVATIAHIKCLYYYVRLSCLNTPMMVPRSAIVSEHAPSSPLFSQAIVCNGMIYASGNIGLNVDTEKVVEGSTGG